MNPEVDRTVPNVLIRGSGIALVLAGILQALGFATYVVGGILLGLGLALWIADVDVGV